MPDEERRSRDEVVGTVPGHGGDCNNASASWYTLGAVTFEEVRAWWKGLWRLVESIARGGLVEARSAETTEHALVHFGGSYIRGSDLGLEQRRRVLWRPVWRAGVESPTHGKRLEISRHHFYMQTPTPREGPP